MSIVRDALKVLDRNLGVKFCIPCWSTASGLNGERDRAALVALAHLYEDIVAAEDSCGVCGTHARVFSGRGRPV